MNPKRLRWFMLALLVLAFTLVGCGADAETIQVEVTRIVEQIQEQEIEVPVEVTRIVEQIQTRIVTEEVLVEAEEIPLGSEERPIQMLFVPSVDADVIVTGGEIMAEELKAATGLNFEVQVPTSYAATIEAMCASPEDTIGFIPGLGYVLANQRCGVQVGNKAVRFGWPVYWAQIIVREDSGIESLEDLAGKAWGAPSVTSTSGYLAPNVLFAENGIEAGEIVETGGHTQAAIAVAQGDVDFATTFFSPPLLPEGTWRPGVDDPEIWRDAGVAPEFVDGRVFVAGGPSEGGYRILDARAAAMETVPDIFETTKILTLSPEIPNDTISFGAEFPLNLSRQIIAALAEYVASDACNNPPEGTVTFCSDAFYNWTGAEPALDSEYDVVRSMIQAAGMTEEDILSD